MINPEDKREIEKLIDTRVKNDFNKKIGDTPTDSLQLVNRKYVNMYGSVSGRPQNSVIGQQYFATDLGYPIFRNNNNAWVSATGSVVG